MMIIKFKISCNTGATITTNWAVEPLSEIEYTVAIDRAGIGNALMQHITNMGIVINTSDWVSLPERLGTMSDDSYDSPFTITADNYVVTVQPITANAPHMQVLYSIHQVVPESRGIMITKCSCRDVVLEDTVPDAGILNRALTEVRNHIISQKHDYIRPCISDDSNLYSVAAVPNFTELSYVVLIMMCRQDSAATSFIIRATKPEPVNKAQFINELSAAANKYPQITERLDNIYADFVEALQELQAKRVEENKLIIAANGSTFTEDELVAIQIVDLSGYQEQE